MRETKGYSKDSILRSGDVIWEHSHYCCGGVLLWWCLWLHISMPTKCVI